MIPTHVTQRLIHCVKHFSFFPFKTDFFGKVCGWVSYAHSLSCVSEMTKLWISALTDIMQTH